MTTIHLTASERFDDAEADALAEALRKHFDVDGPHHLMRKADLLPQFVQLLADYKLWVALGLVASGFLTKIGQRAGDAVWDAIKERLKRKDAKPLADITDALARARKAAGPTGFIRIGLDMPDDRFGTVLTIHDTEPEKIAYAIARFCAKAEDIAATLRTEIDGGRGPAVGVTVTLLEGDAVMLEWQNRSDLKKRQVRID